MKAAWRVVRWSIAPRGAAASGGWTAREAVLVELRDDDGFVGLGEAAPLPNLSPDSLEGTLYTITTLLAGAPAQVTETVQNVGDGVHDRHFAGSPAARFAIESAALDLRARRRGVTIAELLAPAPIPARELRCAVVVDDVDEARAAVAAGARTLKIKVADGDRARVRAIAAAAPGARLRLDANRAWSIDDARAHLAALTDLPIELVEEPCRDSDALRGERIALDESLVATDDLSGLAAIVLKPTLLGIARCMALAARARAAGIAVVVTHALEGPIGMRACVELARAIGTADAGLAPHVALAGWRVPAGGRYDDLRAALSAVPDGAVVRAAAPRSDDLAIDRALSIDDAAADTPDAPAVLHATAISFAAAAAAARHAPPAGALVATPALATLHAIHASLAARRPLALLHHKLAPDVLERQRARVAAAALPPDTAFVLFTSGSTGEPRGVLLSRAAIVASAHASALGWRDDDRWLLALSLAHAGGLAVAVRCLIARKPLVLHADGDDLAASLARCTLASLVPTQLATLLDDPAWRPPAQLRAVLLGGAAAPAPLVDAALARGVPVLATYGMTETFGQIATARVPGGPLVPLPGVALATRGQRLHVRGAMLATRYLDGAPIAPDFATPDLGHVNSANILQVTGRADDVIITGGENVHPAEVEAVLAATPGVRAAVAFGIDDARWGTLVAAALAVEPSFDLAAALARWHDTLPAHARPRRLATRDALPLLPTGKLDRRAAAALATSTIAYRV